MDSIPEVRQTAEQLASEHLAIELLQAEDRIHDLESERDSYRVLATTTLDALRRVTLERDDLRRQIDHWIREERRHQQRNLRRRAA